MAVSGDYPAVVSGATDGNLEVPGASAKGDSDRGRSTCRRKISS